MIKVLILLTFYFFSLAVSIGEPRPIVLGSEDEFKEIGAKLDFLRDPTGKLTIEDINSPKWSSKFVKSTKSVPRFGFTRDTVWLRIKVINNNPEKNWRFNIGLPTLDYLTLFKKVQNKWVETYGGDGYPSTKWEMRYKDIIFALSKIRESTYFIRIINRGGIFLFPSRCFIFHYARSRFHHS